MREAVSTQGPGATCRKESCQSLETLEGHHHRRTQLCRPRQQGTEGAGEENTGPPSAGAPDSYWVPCCPTQLEIAGKGALECRPQGSPFRVQSRGGGKEKNRGQGKKWKTVTPSLSLLSLSPPERVFFWGWLVVSWFSSLLECQLHKDRDLSSCNLGTTPSTGQCAWHRADPPQLY